MAIRWGNNGKSERLYFLGLQNHYRCVTAAMKLKDVCSLEEKKQPRQLTNLDSILKSREITLPSKFHLFKAMVVPVIMYGPCESWTIKKAEHQRIDAFKLWCWKTLESPLDSKEIQAVHSKGNQSWIFLEGLVLKLQYFGYLMQRADYWKRLWCWERLKVGGEVDDRG